MDQRNTHTPIARRRRWLPLMPLLALLLAACGTSGTPQVVEQEVTRIVTQEVEVIVTQEVEVMVTQEVEAAEEETPAQPTPEPFVPTTEIIATGLQNPRQLFYSADGTLYIAEAGSAGDAQITVDPETIVGAGLTSQISAVAPDGTQSVAVPALPSIQTSPGNSGFRGAQAIYVTDQSYWIGFGEGPAPLLGLSYFRTVMEIDRDTWRIGSIIDTGAGALELGQPDPDAVNSDPTDLALADDGTLFIADAGCNCLWTWTEQQGRQLFNAWDIDDNPVPTGIDFGPDGDLYVSFLSGFPFPAEGTRIERWTRDGELVQTFGGLTLATDVLIGDDGTIYAVEFAAGLGERGFIPDSGRVVVVTEDGLTPLLEGLRSPYALALSPDGNLVVSVVSAFDTAASGMVIAVPSS